MFWETHSLQGHNTTPEAGSTGQEQRDVQQMLEQFVTPVLRPILNLLGEGHFAFVGEQR